METHVSHGATSRSNEINTRYIHAVEQTAASGSEYPIHSFDAKQSSMVFDAHVSESMWTTHPDDVPKYVIMAAWTKRRIIDQ